MAVRRRSVQKCDRVGKATGPEVGKANKWQHLQLAKHKHEPRQPASCLPKSRQRLQVYEKEMVRNIIPRLAHYEWGTPFCLLCRGAYPCS